jgi:Virulence-associated protein E/Bifunctional DNA primase/polymerase, N-terminal/Primase C terminal 2 (PriCT-2)
VPSEMLEAALAYSRMSWRVFPLHTMIDGKCSCGKACSSPAKHPRTKSGFKEATDDPEQIRKWWGRYPDANIGIATGSGLVVVDIDGPEGAAEFKELIAANGPLPPTLIAQTGNGFHLFYLARADSPSIRSAARGKVHVRGENGYVVGSPSKHYSGRNYQWIKKLPIAVLPDWLRQWLSGYEITANKPSNALGLGPLPLHLSKQNQRDVGEALHESLKTIWSPSEQARLISALSAIPADNYESWVQVGMALQQLGWEGNGADLGYSIWNSWSETCQAKYSVAACEEKWRSFGRSGRQGVTLGTVYHMARAAGWTGGAPEPMQPKLNGTNGHHALPAAFLAASQGAGIHFPDTNEDGLPKATCTNVAVAVTHMGIVCAKDMFHEKMLVGGEPINQWAGDMSDDVIQMIRKIIRFRYGFDPKVENTRDACTQLCLEHQFDPVCDYLEALQWDGALRLDRWLTTYLGAPDTELNRTIGRITLIAAVRRAFEPGTKFDQIVVFESVEGRGKSTAIEILAGSENFSDQNIIGLQGKEQQEAMAGIWLYEIADLTGMKKADVEHIKAFASRKVDRARPAYGRFRVDRPRRTIFFATTNDDEYLKSQTGNRRFWPVVTGRIDLEALRRDRDQLWAEAAVYEAAGSSIMLPERLWQAAGEEQERRKEGDDWFEKIANYIAMKQLADVTVSDVLCDNQFIMRKPDMVSRADAMRAGAILKRLKFTRYHKRIGDGFAWRYRR